MTGEFATTTNHDRIRRWVEARDGMPAVVRAAGSGDDHLDAIDWSQHFEKFGEAELAFLYQDQTADGGTSRFPNFVERN